MGQITTVHAWANNEVAYVAWDVDKKIKGCLGFDVTRVYLNDDGSVAQKADGSEDRIKCATWVAFKGQSNPNWLPQDTSVWPVQKMSWRDLTLRKKRDGAERRPENVRVRYEIRPVGDLKPGLEAVPSNGLEFAYVTRRDSDGKPVLDDNGKPVKERVKAYTGKVRPLAYLAPAAISNDIFVTTRRGPFRSTFTNGILAAQWLSNVLKEDGVIEPDELINKISNPDDPHRKYLAGDVIPLIHEIFKRKGQFYVGLYELEDEELENLLLENAERIHVILSNTAADDNKKWDARNKKARKRLMDAGVDIQHRMFNNSIHIGHNKFVVNVPPSGGARSVFTGSTNWTSTGIAGQTNNGLLIEDDDVAGAFLAYWKRMKKDALKMPKPFSKAMGDNQQSAEFRTANMKSTEVELADGGGTISVWFSPNTPERKKPTSKKKKAPTPPDLTEVYRCMRLAKDAILFLAFYPGQRGVDCLIGEAIDIGMKDRSLIVSGAVSSPQAMPNYKPKKKQDGEVVEEGDSPATFDDKNISIVRAARIDDRNILGDFGVEQLTAKGAVGAIIHDKLIVVDPRSDDCAVILGSHNLGFKASYSNDENFLIVRGNRDLAAAYAVHIMDVYDHYRFRAIETERKRKGKKGWSGFLETDDDWQEGYVDHSKGAVMRYFAR
ncbi:MAG TPA: phospholipase D-like domain-containing protein [Pyrinomonadaceae bacterium]|nr:phospholipase D-like domain-containing protein [Pyrinomonadaceae bacterium]